MISWEDEVPVITPTWQTQCWLLDPGPFIDIAFEMGFRRFVFRSQYTGKIGQDFRKWIDVYARGREWEVIWVPYPSDFAVLYTSKLGWSQHAAAWPIWRPKTTRFEVFERLWENPMEPGTALGVFGTRSAAEAVIATVEGQEHRVIVAGMPQDEGAWAQIAQTLQIHQAGQPDATIHVHGQKSLGRTIGVAIKSFDHPVRLGWDDGWPRVLMPNGMVWATIKEPGEIRRLWLSVIGVRHRDLTILNAKDLSRKVYETNLASIRWALMNWARAWDFRRATFEDDIETEDLDWDPVRLPIRLRKTKTERENLDRWLCDSCSLQNKCPYSREGSVCIVPDSEPADIAALFGTRNSASIITGLGALLQAQGRRMQRAMREEDELAAAVASGEFDEEDDDGKKRVAKKKVVLSKELTALQNSMFRNAVVLAKIVDPNMAKQLGTKVNVQMVNVGMGNDLTPQALMESVAGILSERGVNIEDATEAMIAEVVAELTGAAPAAIEATGREV